MELSRRNLLTIAAGVPLGAVDQRFRNAAEPAVDRRAGQVGYGSALPGLARSGALATGTSKNPESANHTAAFGTDGRDGDAPGYGAPAYGSPSE